MTFSISSFNRYWAELILTALNRHGVTDVCIAPGSRSTPLTLEAVSNPHLICYSHFDERGLAFFALGLAKAKKRPVAVIVTSGTAVANLHPALAEASISGHDLIFLTADRPQQLLDCGANQTLQQTGMFQTHVVHSINLPLPDVNIPAKWLLSVIDEALQYPRQGAIQINCPFSEPLYGEKVAEENSWSQSLGGWWQQQQPWLYYECGSSSPCITQPDCLKWQEKKGVVVTGRLTAEEGQAVASWAQQLGWPMLSDIQSATGQPLPYADIWLNHAKAKQILAAAEMVIQFGAHIVSKRVQQWLAEFNQGEFWLIEQRHGRWDPYHHQSRRFVVDIQTWLANHPAQQCYRWATELSACVKQSEQIIQNSLSPSLSESWLAHRLIDLLPEQGQLFLGNSLLIRLVDALAQLPSGYPVFANRGVSGIDGLIATACGVWQGSGRPTLAVLGDLSALHDLNSLSLLLQSSAAPLVLIIVNNNGGSIFSLLPTPTDVRESFYRLSHGLHFKHAAAMFNLPYHQPQSWHELQQQVENIWRQGGVGIIEVVVAEHEGANLYQRLIQTMVDKSC